MRVTKVGNLIDFDHSWEGQAKINKVHSQLFMQLDEMLEKNAGSLEGCKINIIMEYHEINGWYALALQRLGARVRWASNDRLVLKYDDLSIAQAVAV